jgi:hypothetical protein
MHLGGTKTDANSCAQICDFRGATNWRVEKNAENCEVWRFDIRPPAPGDAGADSKDADPN